MRRECRERFPRHHGLAVPTCVTHVPWCMSGSLTSGFLWSRWRGKRSRHSRRMRNLQFYVSGKRPMVFATVVIGKFFWDVPIAISVGFRAKRTIEISIVIWYCYSSCSWHAIQGAHLLTWININLSMDIYHIPREVWEEIVYSIPVQQLTFDNG